MGGGWTSDTSQEFRGTPTIPVSGLLAEDAPTLSAAPGGAPVRSLEADSHAGTPL